MGFYFKITDGKMHLYRESGLIDDDLGALDETFTGKLNTHNIIRENFELEDISGLLQKGIRYRIKGPKGLNGIIEKSCSAINMS